MPHTFTDKFVIMGSSRLTKLDGEGTTSTIEVTGETTKSWIEADNALIRQANGIANGKQSHGRHGMLCGKLDVWIIPRVNGPGNL